ncbi:MAG: hypothetical protein M1840_004763 [Geoglossum simile]|nr:MAG: hypothetical protein M1840_004763 [Geoglossum simile]
MDLYACGFNAHRQLGSNGSNGSPPVDRLRLQRVCGGSGTVRVLFAGWADTLLELDGTLRVFGFHCSTQSGAAVHCDVPASRFRSGFGDCTGLKGAVTDDGLVYILSTASGALTLGQHPGPINASQIAIAGNGRACALLGPRNAVDFPDLQDLLRVLAGPHSTTSSTTQTIDLPHHESATHLTATATSFALLAASGTIYTWSTDTRPSPLGRSPVPEPGAHPIDALGGIPIKKLAAAGWLAAAVSRDNELYIWGGSGGGQGGTRRIGDLKRSEGEHVALAKVGAVGAIGEEEDGISVVDVAVGDRHAVALGEDGTIFAVGEGANGQLSTGEVGFAEEWVECEFEGQKEQKRAIGVYCGPRNTFVLVSRPGGTEKRYTSPSSSSPALVNHNNNNNNNNN